MSIIVVVYLYPSEEPINTRIVDWRFASLLSVVGIYHAARGFDEVLGRRSSTTTLTQSGAGSETLMLTETTELPPLR